MKAQIINLSTGAKTKGYNKNEVINVEWCEEAQDYVSTDHGCWIFCSENIRILEKKSKQSSGSFSREYIEARSDLVNETKQIKAKEVQPEPQIGQLCWFGDFEETIKKKRFSGVFEKLDDYGRYIVSDVPWKCCVPLTRSEIEEFLKKAPGKEEEEIKMPPCPIDIDEKPPYWLHEENVEKIFKSSPSSYANLKSQIQVRNAKQVWDDEDHAGERT